MAQVFLSGVRGPKCGRGVACDGDLTADTYPTGSPRSKCGRGLAPDGGLWADHVLSVDRVHIRSCGNGRYGFRPYGGSLLKSAKVSKTLLPHHSAPRLGSVCPNAGLNPWAAVMGHPWPRTANPASCRVTHGFKPAFGQRGLTGRLRSKADQEQEQEQEQEQSKSTCYALIVRPPACFPGVPIGRTVRR